VNAVFADTLYWYGVRNPRDEWHRPAAEARARLGSVQIVTPADVLDEFLAAMSSGGTHLRRTATALVRTILADPTARVIQQSHLLFLRGLELYERRPDKAYSLTDCISMIVMGDEGLTDVLTNDHHFTQDGFNILIRK
jgi:predicted nucleic acid-binding protein